MFTGHKHTQDWKDNNSKLTKGRKLSNEWKNKIGKANKGKKRSEESRKNMSKAFRGRIPWNKGKKIGPMPIEVRIKNSNAHKGDKSYRWKGGIEPENIKIRKGIEYRLWREAVFARDNWTDQKYGIKGGRLVAHHIQNFAQFPELRFAIDNGITLSEKAHQEFHKKYGFKNNNKNQIKEFLIIQNYVRNQS